MGEGAHRQRGEIDASFMNCFIAHACRNNGAVASHPGLPDIRRLAVLLRRLLPLLFLGAVAAVEAAGGRAQYAMVAGIVTGNTADGCAFQAALGVGG